MKIGFDVYESPLGPLFVVADETGVRRLVLFEAERDVEMCRGARKQSPQG